MRMFSKLRRITARSSAPVIGVAASAGGVLAIGPGRPIPNAHIEERPR